MDRLVESSDTVLNTSSVVNRWFGRVNIDDLDAARGYRPLSAYANAKLEIILFTKELHRRYHAAGISTAAYHPGNVATNFGNESQTRWMRTAFRGPIKHLALIVPERGSDELVRLASSTPGIDWESGEYYANHRTARANPQAYDPVLAHALWERSLAMVAI